MQMDKEQARSWAVGLVSNLNLVPPSLMNSESCVSEIFIGPQLGPHAAGITHFSGPRAALHIHRGFWFLAAICNSNAVHFRFSEMHFRFRRPSAPLHHCTCHSHGLLHINLIFDRGAHN